MTGIYQRYRCLAGECQHHLLLYGTENGSAGTVQDLDPQAVADAQEGRFGRALFDGLDHADLGEAAEAR